MLSERQKDSHEAYPGRTDRAGVYAAQLVVSDGELESEPCAIQIQAFTVQTEAIAALQGLEAGIAALDSGALSCLSFEIVSYFDIRISNLVAARGRAG